MNGFLVRTQDRSTITTIAAAGIVKMLPPAKGPSTAKLEPKWQIIGQSLPMGVSIKLATYSYEAQALAALDQMEHFLDELGDMGKVFDLPAEFPRPGVLLQ